MPVIYGGLCIHFQSLRYFADFFIHIKYNSKLEILGAGCILVKSSIIVLFPCGKKKGEQFLNGRNMVANRAHPLFSVSLNPGSESCVCC
jgi:hypothetical protein